MKLFLCLNGEGLYYAGQSEWVRDRKQALDLETMKRATEVALHEDRESMVIVLSGGDPSADWFVPIPRRQPAHLSQDRGTVLPKAA